MILLIETHCWSSVISNNLTKMHAALWRQKRRLQRCYTVTMGSNSTVGCTLCILTKSLAESFVMPALPSQIDMLALNKTFQVYSGCLSNNNYYGYFYIGN